MREGSVGGDPCISTRRKSMCLEYSAAEGGVTTLDNIMDMLKEIQK